MFNDRFTTALGKTMLARRITTILPKLNFEESLEISKIHSVAGKIGNNTIINERPFRTPHHTISTAGLIRRWVDS